MKYLAIILAIALITGCATGASGHGNVKFHVRGQVIDQYDHPVSDVKVTYQYAYNDTMLLVLPSFYPTVKTGHFTTDKDGRFDLGMFSVQSIIIVRVSKPGYYYAAQNPKYSINEKEKVQPLNIHLWKIGQSAYALVKKKIRMHNIDADGSEYTLDLHHGVFGKTIKSGTDIKIAIKQMKPNPGNRDGDWSMIINVPDGGVIETTDIYMFEAPSVGYQSNWRMNSSYGKPGYSSNIKKKFYFKLNSGKAYGSMEVYTLTYTTNSTSSLTIFYTLNPNGSRNLYQK